jgi:hypothetical protein
MYNNNMATFRKASIVFDLMTMTNEWYFSGSLGKASSKLISRVWLIDAVCIGNRIYLTFKQLVSTLHSSLLHTLGLLSLFSLPLLGNGFQRQTFPFLWGSRTLPGLSYQLLTTTELQQSAHQPTNSLTFYWLLLSCPAPLLQCSCCRGTVAFVSVGVAVT